jgi:Protein of unknown function (DUF3060)
MPSIRRLRDRDPVHPGRRRAVRARQKRRYPCHREGVEQTIDCNGATLLVDGTRNTVNALGTCWVVTVMGSGHTVVADNVGHDITVYGSKESVFYKNGQPFVWDRGRELGMTNRISHVAG